MLSIPDKCEPLSGDLKLLPPLLPAPREFARNHKPHPTFGEILACLVLPFFLWATLRFAPFFSLLRG